MSEHTKQTPGDKHDNTPSSPVQEHSHEHVHAGTAHVTEEHCHEHTHAFHQTGGHEHGRQRLGGTVLTVRALAGLSGDMMLGGLAALAELSQDELHALVDELRLPALKNCLTVEERSVNHILGVGCRIDLPHEHAHRTLADVRRIIEDSAMPAEAKELAVQAFAVLARAEGAVHGKQPDEVTFHEVGALDSILDTCLVCRIFTLLRPGRFVCSPLPLADGVIRCAHGQMPSPAPAVFHMLPGVPVRSFSGQGETVTPTALSLLKALKADFGDWPHMTVKKTVISYGGKVFVDAPNGSLWALGEE